MTVPLRPSCVVQILVRSSTWQLKVRRLRPWHAALRAASQPPVEIWAARALLVSEWSSPAAGRHPGKPVQGGTQGYPALWRRQEATLNSHAGRLPGHVHHVGARLVPLRAGVDCVQKAVERQVVIHVPAHGHGVCAPCMVHMHTQSAHTQSTCSGHVAHMQCTCTCDSACTCACACTCAFACPFACACVCACACTYSSSVHVLSLRYECTTHSRHKRVMATSTLLFPLCACRGW